MRRLWLLLALLILGSAVGQIDSGAEPASEEAQEEVSSSPSSKPAPPTLSQPFIVHDLTEQEALGTNVDQKIVTPEFGPSNANRPSRGLVPAIVVSSLDDNWKDTTAPKLPIHEPPTANGEENPVPPNNLPTPDISTENRASASREAVMQRTTDALDRLNKEYQAVKAHLSDLNGIREKLKGLYQLAHDTSVPEVDVGALGIKSDDDFSVDTISSIPVSPAAASKAVPEIPAAVTEVHHAVAAAGVAPVSAEAGADSTKPADEAAEEAKSKIEVAKEQAAAPSQSSETKAEAVTEGVQAAASAVAQITAQEKQEEALEAKLLRQHAQLKGEGNELAASVVQLQLDLERAKLGKLSAEGEAVGSSAAAAAAKASANEAQKLTLDEILEALRTVLSRRGGAGAAEVQAVAAAVSNAAPAATSAKAAETEKAAEKLEEATKQDAKAVAQADKSVESAVVSAPAAASATPVAAPVVAAAASPTPAAPATEPAAAAASPTPTAAIERMRQRLMRGGHSKSKAKATAASLAAEEAALDRIMNRWSKLSKKG